MSDMKATSAETTATQLNPLRVPAATADLLPPEIIEARRMRRVRRTVIFAMVPILVLVAGWYGLAVLQAELAERSLSRVDDAVITLQAQQREFDEVTRTRSDSAQIKTQLNALFADDLRWAGLLLPVRRVAPAGVTLTNLSALKSDDRTTGGTGGTGGQPVGSLTISGTAPTKNVVAAYVDALDTVPGLADPLLVNALAQNGVLRFSVRVDVTADAIGGRFTATSKNGAGK
jgi:Tfp pilus assembly protein PilN